MRKSLHMIELKVDSRGVAAWQRQQGLQRSTASLDMAYHQLLTETFGDLAPRPFRVMRNRILYGYTDRCADGLLAMAETVAPPGPMATLNVKGILSKQVPDSWPHDKVLAFEVVVQPLKRPRTASGKIINVDALRPEMPQTREHREIVYRDWLQEHVDRETGAEILDSYLHDFRIARSVRRRRARSFSHPVAVMRGKLRVTHDGRFNTWLKHGVGRQTRYGYGMILIRPNIEK